MEPSLKAVSRRCLLIAGGLASLAAGPARAATDRFTSGVQGSKILDHSALGALLETYARLAADGVVRVDYAGWAASPNDLQRLKRYLSELSRADPLSLTRAEQFAYWANLYNALTLDVVLAAFPVRSIRDIRPSLLAAGPWRQERITVGGVRLSLDAIEHDILRRAWRDPRVHYAVNCASFSCPDLPRRAWRGAGLQSALDEAARTYVNHPRAVRFEGDALVVSSIYRWYAEDFGSSDAVVIAHLARFARPPLAARLKASRRIARTTYDWSLNAVRKAG
ncbi:MAG: DUF547 domain-containing protein [Phenylobacterium sp.]|uniref:DUF547 domain-containing protein n=1 Tax=Phenylobacterium sp. TaxID=1871053 RepID=UPI0025E76079|nr:DUF547 domain-containing protein [Phenylobacterium sp.]MCA6257393.1 DUF547 domain-containing protein [Phenylobacterium sp.]